MVPPLELQQIRLAFIPIQPSGVFHKLCEKIALKQQQRREAFSGEIKVGESYFGETRKGKRGRGAAGKVSVLGILKRGGKVDTQIILDAKSKTLMPLIRCKIRPDSIVYSVTREGSVLCISRFIVNDVDGFL